MRVYRDLLLRNSRRMFLLLCLVHLPSAYPAITPVLPFPFLFFPFYLLCALLLRLVLFFRNRSIVSIFTMSWVLVSRLYSLSLILRIFVLFIRTVNLSTSCICGGGSFLLLPSRLLSLFRLGVFSSLAVSFITLGGIIIQRRLTRYCQVARDHLSLSPSISRKGMYPHLSPRCNKKD